MKFHDYFAAAETRSRCYFDFENEEDKYFEHGFIHIYGIPEGLSENELDNIYNGSSDKTVYLGEVIGTLILGNQMAADDENFLMLCDDMSADLSYVAASLIAEDIIDMQRSVYADIYYIYELEMEKGFDDLDLKCEILEKLPYILFSLYHVKPEYLAYYPLPLDRSNEEALVPKHNVSLKIDPKITADGLDAIRAEIMVNDDQLDTLIDSRSSYSPYPASAKDKQLWDLYEACGFEEAGKTKLLYMTVI